MRERNRILDIILYIVFAFYLLLLCAILFRTSQPVRSVNLIPFNSIMAYVLGSNKVMASFAFINVIGNIVIFIPLGIYLTLFDRTSKIIKTVLYVFIISFLVEVLQYTFMMGIGDIDDVILNVFGGLVGAIIYKILLLIVKDKIKSKNIISIFAPIGGALSYAFLILGNI